MNTIKRNNAKHQRGATKLGLLVMLMLVASFFIFGLRVAPLYIDHNLVTGICNRLIENGEAADMSVTQLRATVSDSLRINNIRDFEMSSIRMRKENGNAIITIAYERRIHFVGNLDMIAAFNTELR